MAKSANVSCGCGGCIGTIVTILVVWALIFGVTYEGRHHEIVCSKKDGVTVESSRR